jgi:type I restriction enzyme S subunit
MAVSQHLIAWLPGHRITAVFLLRVFNAMREELDRYTFGTTIKTIGMDDVKALTTTVPPVEEQEAICKHIDGKVEKFDLLIRKAEQQIALLKEHRVSLISSAVTGKIDVRGWRKTETEAEETSTAVSA